MALSSSLGVMLPASRALAEGYCAAQLTAQVQAIATRPALNRGRLGIQVEIQGSTPGERTVILSRDADQFFIPASSLKLLTTAAALHALGPDFQVRTSVYGDSGSPTTNLTVVGRGDPTLTDLELHTLAQQLARQGITQVEQLWGDDHYFPGRAYHPNWEWEDVQAGYGAPVNSLILNQNALTLTLHPTTVGQPLRVEWDDPTQADRWQIQNFSQTLPAGNPASDDLGQDFSRPLLQVFGGLSVEAAPDPFAIAIPQPGEYFLHRFTQILAQHQITVQHSGLRSAPLTLAGPELAAVTSRPLADWLPIINGESHNLYAEALLKALGVANRTSHTITDDATVQGVQAVKSTLASLGIPPDTYEMVDGSGLSRHNLVTPKTLVALLQHMANHPQSSLYRHSLAVAGERGNLSHRFQGTAVQGKLQGKTGYVRNHESLSGYLALPDHPPMVFSIMLNNVNQPAQVMRDMVDEIVLDLAKFQECSARQPDG